MQIVIEMKEEKKQHKMTIIVWPINNMRVRLEDVVNLV